MTTAGLEKTLGDFMGLLKDLFVPRILSLQVAALGLFPTLFSPWEVDGRRWPASEDSVEGSFEATRKTA